jgi:hypothetical protein
MKDKEHNVPWQKSHAAKEQKETPSSDASVNMKQPDCCKCNNVADQHEETACSDGGVNVKRPTRWEFRAPGKSKTPVLAFIIYVLVASCYGELLALLVYLIWLLHVGPIRDLSRSAFFRLRFTTLLCTRILNRGILPSYRTVIGLGDSFFVFLLEKKT